MCGILNILSSTCTLVLAVDAKHSQLISEYLNIITYFVALQLLFEQFSFNVIYDHLRILFFSSPSYILTSVVHYEIM